MKRSAACKGFRGPKLPADPLMQGADVMLEKATVSVQNNQPVSTTFESLYTSVADLLQPKFAKHLCDRLDQLIDDHTKEVLNQFNQNDLEPMHFLRQMNECWRNNCEQLKMIKGIYLILDRKYVLSESSIMSIWDLGIDKFRLYFTNNTIIQRRTVEEILNLIQQERNNLVIDRGLVKDLLSMMSTLSVYRSLFEPNFLDETQRLYRAESQRLVNEMDVPAYLKYVNRIISEETERSNLYLESLTHIPLIETIERELIATHLTLIVAKGLDQLLDDMRLDDLILLHNLLSRVPNGITELCNHFNKHIKQRGQVIVMDLEKDKSMVQDLLEFKIRMDQVVNECFQKQEKFVYSLKDGFEYFINRRPNKPAELIAKFIDSKLRAGNKEATEDELEKILDQILVLFRFIHGKDVFEAFYKKDLAKRLLLNTSASVDAEKSMLSKLKQECGAAFTGKLEGMFKDIELSRDMMTSFRNHMQSHKINSQVDLNVNVLTMGFWPTYQIFDINLPKFLKKQQAAFEKFYTTKHNGRKLQWQPNLGQCILIADFQSELAQQPSSSSQQLSQQSGRHELVVSLFQALVLLMFNEKNEYEYKEILEATKIDPIELKRTLQSLACAKLNSRVITKEPKGGRDVMEGDKFIFNAKFTSAHYKIKINQVQLKETHEEQSMTEERVFQDRQYQIDAALVRIMKTRKKLDNTSLINEIVQHVKFPVNNHDIKVRIESLIERDYLQRDQDNAQIYNYVA